MGVKGLISHHDQKIRVLPCHPLAVEDEQKQHSANRRVEFV